MTDSSPYEQRIEAATEALRGVLSGRRRAHARALAVIALGAADDAVPTIPASRAATYVRLGQPVKEA